MDTTEALRKSSLLQPQCSRVIHASSRLSGLNPGLAIGTLLSFGPVFVMWRYGVVAGFAPCRKGGPARRALFEPYNDINLFQFGFY